MRPEGREGLARRWRRRYRSRPSQRCTRRPSRIRTRTSAPHPATLLRLVLICTALRTRHASCSSHSAGPRSLSSRHGIRKARLEDGQPCNVRVCVGSAIQKHTKSVCVHAPCVDVNVVWRCRVCVDDHNGYIGKRRFEIDAFLDYSFSARHDHQPAGLYMGYGKLRQKKHGLAVSIGSLLRHRDGGSAPVSQKSPGSFDRDVKSRLSVAFDRHDAERSLSRSDAGRQLAVFEGLPRLHCPGDDQLDIQHGNFAVCLQCGPVANSGLGYGKLCLYQVVRERAYQTRQSLFRLHAPYFHRAV